ncbi:hypothetical protein BB561_004881 [Smittium simulii]|uniref:Uncharacterized protein n=1 Tax=Smittium simulii TaxID=133385 RepID=A0A2T9YDR1_9FUNG|nr:hypothetical protein BB561_004881 [Smittium simulii]
MSRITISYACEQVKKRQYCLIELHGSIKTDVESLNGLKIGTFELCSDKSAFLVVGSHRLLGKAVPLKKALAMLIKAPDTNQTSMEIDNSTALDSIQEYQTACYDILAVIKYKFVFLDRPSVF